MTVETIFSGILWLLDKVLFGLITKYRGPKLTLVIKQGKFYQNAIEISQREDGDFEASFRIAIKNFGRGVLKPGEGYWHLYFPSASDVEADPESKKFTSSDMEHLRNPIDLVIFPGSFLDVGPEFKIFIKKDAMSNFKIYYFFETSAGYFPKKVKINSETGGVLYENMASVPIKIM